LFGGDCASSQERTRRCRAEARRGRCFFVNGKREERLQSPFPSLPCCVVRNMVYVVRDSIIPAQGAEEVL
jgi:hypothetical protein